MTRRIMVLLALVAACTPASMPRHAAPSSVPSPTPNPPVTPAPQPPPTAFSAGSLGDTGKEGGILVRFDIESTFRLVSRCGVGGALRSDAAVKPFGHVPRFTLYEDGSVVFVREDRDGLRVLRAQIGEGGAHAFVDQLVALGIERVASYTDDCSPKNAGERFCISDAGFTVIELRLPSGERRVLRNYAGMANEQQALKEVLERLEHFAHMSERDYLPTHATLLIERCDEADPKWPAWPLAPGVLTPPAPEVKGWAVRVLGDLYQAFYGQGTRLGSVRGFQHDGHGYAAVLVPILPGTTELGAIDRYRSQ